MTQAKLSAGDLAKWAALEDFPPYSYYADFPAAARVKYRGAQLESMAASAAHRTFSVDGAGGEALVGLTSLAWDTAQLGLPAGRVDYVILKRTEAHGAENGRSPRPPAVPLAGMAAAAVTRASDEMGIRHLSARFDSRDLAVIQAMEAAGFQLVDAILRFALDAKDFTRPVDLPPGVEIRDAAEADIPALADLAAKGFIYDRFHNDPSLGPGVADRVHAEWLTNAVHGRTGDGVVMGLVDGKPAGFFILALDKAAGTHFDRTVGTLVLITVDREVRRRGVARALSLASVEWLRERGATRFEVGTQLANVPAANVYLTAGFRLVQTSVSLRRLAP